MPNVFDRMQRVVDAEIGARMAVEVIVRPQTVSQYLGPEPDSTRPVQPIQAVVSLVPSHETITAGGRASGAVNAFTHASAQSATIWITSATLEAMGYAIKTGDHIATISPMVVWRVSDLRPDGAGGLEIILSPAEGGVPS